MMKKRNLLAILLIGALLLASGCAVMSKELRREAEKDLPFTEVFKNPELHRGKVVIWDYLKNKLVKEIPLSSDPIS